MASFTSLINKHEKRIKRFNNLHYPKFLRKQRENDILARTNGYLVTGTLHHPRRKNLHGYLKTLYFIYLNENSNCFH